MICNYSSVLFIYIIFIFCCEFIPWAISNYLILSDVTIIKCSDYEYLVIDDWYKFVSSNISCPNQTALFDKSTVMYNYTEDSYICDAATKTIAVKFYGSILSEKKNEKTNLSAEQLPQLFSVIRIKNHNYSFEPSMMENGDKASVHNITLNWSDDMMYYLYINFTAHPTLCRIYFDYSRAVKNNTCTGASGAKSIRCYSEPFSKIRPQTVNWTKILALVNDKPHYAINWKENGGYYVDLRLIETTTTTSATSTTVTATVITTTIATTTIPATTLSTKQSTHQKTTRSFKKTTKILKPSRNNSQVLKQSPSKKRSSSPSIRTILLIVFIACCIIGSVLFFVFRFRRKQQNNDGEFVDRVDSKESNRSDMDESEGDQSTDTTSKLSEEKPNRKGGRSFNQLDPDTL